MGWFGPVFQFEMARLGRRRTLLWVRWLYLLLLVLVTCWSFYNFTELLAAERANILAVQGRVIFLNSNTTNPASNYFQRNLPRYGNYFFNYYLFLQSLMMVVIAPALIAGSIAEEKNRKTLEDLLTTQISNREIVWGKFLPRFIYLAWVMLGTWPILAMMQLLGGIDPTLFLYTLPLSLIALVAIGAWSLFFSVRSTRPRDAIMRTYCTLVFFLLLWLIPYGMQWRGWLQSIILFDQDSLQHWQDFYSCFNPFAAFFLIMEQSGQTDSLYELALSKLMWNAASMLLVSSLLICLSTRQIRDQYLRPRYSPAKKPGRVTLRPVWKNALLWKEWVTQHRPTFDRVFFGFSLALLPAWFWLHSDLLFAVPNPRNFGLLPRYSNFEDAWVEFRLIATVLFAVFYLRIALRAASAFSQEKEQDTWITLISAPWTFRDIHFAKAMGGVRLMIVLAGYLIGCTVVGVLLQLIDIRSIFVIGMQALVQCFFVTMLGLYMSVRSASTLRAVLATVIVLGVLAGLPFMMIYSIRLFNLGESPLTIFLGFLTVLSFIWIPALLVALLLIYIKYFLPKLIPYIWYLLKGLAYTFVGFFGILLVVFLTFKLLETSLSLFEILAMVSVLFQQFNSWMINDLYKTVYFGRFGRFANDLDDFVFVLFVMNMYYLGAALVLRSLTLRYLRNKSDRVDGHRPSKRAKLNVAHGS